MAKKKTTRVRLVERAAAAKSGPRAAPAKKPARSVSKPAAPAADAPAVPGLQADDIQETVRTVVTYVQQNPLAAAAVAIGVGVMLSSMYWETRSTAPGKPRASR
jgi:hypothetical protein